MAAFPRLTDVTLDNVRPEPDDGDDALLDDPLALELQRGARQADAVAAFAEDFAIALSIQPLLSACDDDLDVVLDFSGAGVGSAKLRLRADGKVSVGLLDDLTAHFAPQKVEAPASQGLSQKRTARAFQPSKKRRA